MFSCKYCEIFRNTYFEERMQTAASNDVKLMYLNIKIAIKTDRLFKLCEKTVHFSSGFSFSEKHDIQLTIRFTFSVQLYNDFVLLILLPPHELSRDFPREKEYISENLQKTIFLKFERLL